MGNNSFDIAEVLVHFSEFPNRIEFLSKVETIRCFEIYVDGNFVSKNFSDCMDFSRQYHIEFYRYDAYDQSLKLWVVKK